MTLIELKKQIYNNMLNALVRIIQINDSITRNEILDILEDENVNIKDAMLLKTI